MQLSSSAAISHQTTKSLLFTTGYGAVYVNDRIFHYARYLDWLVTTPLLLLDLGGLCRVGLEESMMLVVLDILMVLAGLAGGLSDGLPCFWMWLLGCVFFLPILYDLLFTFRIKAAEVGSSVSATYSKLMGLTVVLWTLYPVVFVFAEYGHAFSDTVEILCYGILDVTAKCVFGFILLTSHDSIKQAMEGYSPIGA